MNLNFKKLLLQAKAFLQQAICESNTHDDDDFQIGSYGEHLSGIDDLITFGLQEVHIYEDPRAYSRNKTRLSLSRLCTSDNL